MRPKDPELVCAHLHLQNTEVLYIAHFSSRHIGVSDSRCLKIHEFNRASHRPYPYALICIHIKSFPQTRFCTVVKLAMTTRTGSLLSKILKRMMLGTIARVALLYISYIICII